MQRGERYQTLDKFAKRRKIPNPVHEDFDVDCTAFAVLQIVELYHFDGHHTLVWLIHRVDVYIEHLQEAYTDKAQVLRNITHSIANKRDLQAPSDVRKPRAQHPRWKLMLLTTYRTSSNKQLVAIVSILSAIHAHTHRDLRMCCDMKALKFFSPKRSTICTS